MLDDIDSQSDASKYRHNSTIICIWVILLLSFAGIIAIDILRISSIPKRFGIQLINNYQLYISPTLSATTLIQCRYKVTCSEYAKQKIAERGLTKGLIIGIQKILTCY